MSISLALDWINFICIQVRDTCFSHSYSMLKTSNEEIGNLAKPKRKKVGSLGHKYLKIGLLKH